MKRLLVLTLIGLVSLTLILGGCAQSSPASSNSTSATNQATAVKPIELSFAHFQAPDSYASKNFLIPWAKKVEQATNGKVKMVIYPSETLVKQNETVTGVEQGIADIGWVSEAQIVGRFPVSEVTGLPFMGLLTGKDSKGTVLSAGLVNSLIFEELYENNPDMQKEHESVKVLFAHCTLPAYMVTKDKPVRNLADLKGMKIRTSAGLQTQQLKALGAAPMTIPFNDVYDAAQKGTLEGAAANSAQLTNSRLFEVIHYRTDLNLGTTTMFTMIMNKNKWNSLPKDVQDGIMSVSGMAGASFAGEQGFGFGVEQELTDLIKKGNYKFETVQPDAGEYAKWVEIGGKPVWNTWLAGLKAKGLDGQKALDQLLAITKKYDVK